MVIELIAVYLEGAVSLVFFFLIHLLHLLRVLWQLVVMFLYVSH